jgi:hypothetical protein
MSYLMPVSSAGATGDLTQDLALYTEVATEYGGELASTRVCTVWEKRAEVPDASLKAGTETNADNMALAA